MKKITATITTTNVTADFYNVTEEKLERFSVVKRGENVASLDYKEVAGYITCKIIEKSEPITAKYEMTLDDFISMSHESDMYMQGFMNRKIGGEVVTVLVFDNDTNENKQVEYSKASERELKKSCEEDNSIFIKILNSKKVDEKFYYMSYEEFTTIAKIVEK